jgi:hypothetical protein
VPAGGPGVRDARIGLNPSFEHVVFVADGELGGVRSAASRSATLDVARLIRRA